MNERRGSSLVPRRMGSPTDQGRAFLGIFMMRTRWHHEYMRVSPTRTDHLIGKQGMCARLVGSACLPCRVVQCRVVDSVASPQSNMGFCVHSAVFPLYGAEQQMEAGGET